MFINRIPFPFIVYIFIRPLIIHKSQFALGSCVSISRQLQLLKNFRTGLKGFVIFSASDKENIDFLKDLRSVYR